MSSIKLKDDAGNWIYYGGTTKNDIDWVQVTTSTQIVPSEGGYYSISATNDQGYVFLILPAAPANGTIVGVQVIDNPVTYAYLQPSGTDTIDYQATAILARNTAQLIERVRYYNGHWFRLNGSYTYAPPPQVGPYALTTLSTFSQQTVVSISPISTASAIEIRATIGRLEIFYPNP